MLSRFFPNRKSASQPGSDDRPEGPEQVLAELCRTIAGLELHQVESEQITKGLSSLSLTRYSGPGGPFMIRKSIEKERQPEADFMRTLCAPVKPLRELSALSWSMPDVYRVVETKGSFDIYMEFIQGIGFRPLVERASLERSLARAIYDLQFILPALCRCHGVELKERGNPGSAFRSKIAPHVSPDLWKKLKGIIKLQKSLPVLASHNDIFWPNLGVREDGDEQAIAFIDFGLIGLNVAGAELHHFARAAFRSGKEARFFRSLSKHYATTARFDQDLIELNAFFYSAQRLIAHEGETRFPASRGLSEDARRLLEAAAERYDTARMKLRRAVSG